MQKEVKFGLLGKNISYSFSKKYFTQKFSELKLDHCTYVNFDIPAIDDLPLVLDNNIENLKGLNVTIPYKEAVIKYLDEIDGAAEEIGAVNTIKILDGFRLKGYNTDVYGFKNSLKPLLKSNAYHALILGTGGASKAVSYVLDTLQIPYKFVSRNPQNVQSISYREIDELLLSKYHLIINCTPVGTYPKIDSAPDLPYHYLTDRHILYDLIYNPAMSSFLQKGKDAGAVIKNGEEMLQLQAEKSWEIWQS